MTRTFLKAEQQTFNIILPINWGTSSPYPIVMESAEQYAATLPTVKDNVSLESFKFLFWNFGQESWIREASMSVHSDGTRYLDTAKFRENKIRYLMQEWSLVNESGVVEPLQHVVIDGRRMLNDASIQKIGKLDSILMFLVAGLADKVINGLIPVEALYTMEDFKELLAGNVPQRLRDVEKVQPSPKL